jgi:hypothetical protein
MNVDLSAYPPAIRRHMQRLQFSFVDTHWGTCNDTYRVRCSQGHLLSLQAKSLQGFAGCPRCRERERMARLRLQTEQDGSRCLDDEWQGSRHFHRFRCLRNASHEWRRTFADAARNSRCPHCVHRGRVLDKDGLQRLKNYCVSHGGDCLSLVYLGINHKHVFRCGEGHVWQATGHSLLVKNSWCSRCATREYRLDMEDLRRVAQSRGGEVLSTQYLGYEELYQWRCAKQHTWQATYRSVQGGVWCPQCVQEKRRLDPEVMHQVAAQRGGRCLSTTYRGAREKYLWECAKGHRWLAVLYSVKQGGWCPQCLRVTLEDLQQVAAQQGGQCLSRQCQGANARHQWLCEKGHQWSATYANIKTGHWCPACANMARATPGSAAWMRYQAHVPRDG